MEGLGDAIRWQAGLLGSSISDFLLLFICLGISAIVQEWYRHIDFEKGTSCDTHSQSWSLDHHLYMLLSRTAI